jgi:hypothetical protein
LIFLSIYRFFNRFPLLKWDFRAGIDSRYVLELEFVNARAQRDFDHVLHRGQLLLSGDSDSDSDATSDENGASTTATISSKKRRPQAPAGGGDGGGGSCFSDLEASEHFILEFLDILIIKFDYFDFLSFIHF